MGARTEGGTEGKEGETEDLGSNSTNDSSMAWRGVVAPNSSDNRGGASLATVAVVEEVLGGRAEGVVVDLPGGGAVVQSLSTPPAPGGYVFPPSYPSHLPRPQGSAPAVHPDDPRERCPCCNQIGHRHQECPYGLLQAVQTLLHSNYFTRKNPTALWHSHENILFQGV